MTTKLDDELGQLIKLLQGLGDAPPTVRARAARGLVELSRTVLSAVGDAAVVEATAAASYKEISAELGVSEAAINKAVTRNRQRLEREDQES